MKRVLFYVQNLLGIGHSQRAALIAQALRAAGAQVTVVGGGLAYREFPVDYLQLPPVYVRDGDFTLLTAQGSPPNDLWWRDRRHKLEQIFQAIKPEILLIETYPFGRRAFRFELDPLLKVAVSTVPRPVIACSLRDILVPRKDPTRYQSTVETLNHFFDQVLIHSDPSLIRLERTFPLTDLISKKLVYTGYVAPAPPPLGVDHDEILVSVGGGGVGWRLLQTACRAALESDGRWRLLTGPYLPAEQFQALLTEAPSNVQIERLHEDFASLLTGCRASISQGGYNTLLNIVQARCRAIVVPFDHKGEVEQTLRASLFEQKGLLQVLLEADLSPETLHQRLKALPSRPAEFSLNLNGAEYTARFLLEG